MKSIPIFVSLMFCVSLFPILGFSVDLDAYAKLKDSDQAKVLLEYAYQILNHEFNTDSTQSPPAANLLHQSIAPWPGGYAGVFVTLIKHGQVRGCIGSFFPEEHSLVDTIQEMTIRATYQDNRTPPVSRTEVNDLDIIITITGDWEAISDPHTVDLMRYGLLIRYQEHRAVLLPGEARTTSWGIRTLMREAGISSQEELEYYRFQVVTYDGRYE